MEHSPFRLQRGFYVCVMASYKNHCSFSFIKAERTGFGNMLKNNDLNDIQIDFIDNYLCNTAKGFFGKTKYSDDAGEIINDVFKSKY